MSSYPPSSAQCVAWHRIAWHRHRAAAAAAGCCASQHSYGLRTAPTARAVPPQQAEKHYPLYGHTISLQQPVVAFHVNQTRVGSIAATSRKKETFRAQLEASREERLSQTK